MSAALSVSKIDDVFIAINQTTTDRACELLEDSALVPAVTNETTLSQAAQIITSMKLFTREVEKSRVDVKAPVLALSKKIDSLASLATKEVELEIARLQKSSNDYAWKLEQARRQAEQDAKREAIRLETERMNTIAAARTAPTEEGRKELFNDAAQIKEEIKRVQAPVALAVPETVKAKAVWDFEVLDVEALFASNPRLCDLTPKRALIKSMVAAGTREIPGVRIFETISVKTA